MARASGITSVFQWSVLDDWQSGVADALGAAGPTVVILDAWRLPYRLIKAPSQFDEMRAFLSDARQAARPAVALIAEGRA